MPTKNPRFSLTLAPELYQEIEDYRFNHRLKSQNQAVVELLRAGIKAMEGEKPPQPKGPRELEEEELIKSFGKLSDHNRELILFAVKVLCEQPE